MPSCIRAPPEQVNSTTGSPFSVAYSNRRVSFSPTTEPMDAIIDIVERLIENGHAYVAENGDVYFRTKSFPEYGKLCHQPMEELQAGARISVGEVKEDPMDFAVWKAAKPGEPAWDTPWGSKGRPGWHIECSAMANKYLGKTIDIHSGGLDLIFPHHENEIAQSECANGCTFAHYWLHNGFLTIDNEKMSKSKGNFFMVRDAAKQFGYETIRMFMLSAHYRTPLNYSAESLEMNKASLARLYEARNNMEFRIEKASGDTMTAEETEKLEALTGYKQKFIDAMDDDLNTADALSAIFELTREINAYQPGIGLDDEVSRTVYASAMLLLKPRKRVSLGYIVRNHMLLSPMAQAYIQAMEEYAEKYKQSHLT